MRIPLLAALSLVMILSACGSRLNPFNWFKSSEVTAPMPQDRAAPVDPRALAAQIVEMKVEPMPGGVIVRATALPPTQGWWDAELVARKEDEGGARVYDFRIFPPKYRSGVNVPRSRQITAATFISDRQLAGLSSITVQGTANAMTSRR